jgi:hypothetical protein
MTSQNKYKWVFATLLVVGFIWAAWPEPIREDRTKIKLFCTNGRVFIEFEEKYNTWGTMWLDDDGKPVSCGDDGRFIEEKLSTRITI